jgi:hypothetical protein
MLEPDELWRRVAAGNSLDGLGLTRIDSRWNLRSIGSPGRPWSHKDPLPTIQKVILRDLDLSDAELHHFRFFDCKFENCVFDGARLVDLRMWGTSVRRSSFRKARIAGGMGGDTRSPNEWHGVDFDGADLRASSHTSESYIDCNFSSAKLTRVDFDGSRHTRSRFSGLMEEVEFRALPKGVKRSNVVNVMEGVDLSSATVRDSTFHKLDLSDCRLPTSPDHLSFEDRGYFAHRVLNAIHASGRPHTFLRVVMERTAEDSLPGGGGPGFQHRLDVGETTEEIDEAVALMRTCGAR